MNIHRSVDRNIRGGTEAVETGTDTMQYPEAAIATDEIEELRWYLERMTPSATYFGQEISPKGDVYRVVSDENAIEIP